MKSVLLFPLDSRIQVDNLEESSHQKYSIHQPDSFCIYGRLYFLLGSPELDQEDKAPFRLGSDSKNVQDMDYSFGSSSRNIHQVRILYFRHSHSQVGM